MKVYLVKDADPSSAIFCASHNYIYNTALLNTDVPYGTKGFIVMKKGGDASVFKEGQATGDGWPDAVTFQTQVGMMPGDVEGTLGTEGGNVVLLLTLREASPFTLIQLKAPPGTSGGALLFSGVDLLQPRLYEPSVV